MTDPTTTPTPTETRQDTRERVIDALFDTLAYSRWAEADRWVVGRAADAVLAAVSAAAQDEQALGVAADLIDWLADARDEYASAGGPYADAIHQETALTRTLAKALRNPEDAWGWLPTWMVPEYEARHAAALAACPAPTVSGECDHARAAREIARTTPLSLDAATALIDSLARGAATLADAWDEGFVAGYADGTETGMTDPPNPYRTVADAPAAEDEGGRER